MPDLKKKACRKLQAFLVYQVFCLPDSFVPEHPLLREFSRYCSVLWFTGFLAEPKVRNSFLVDSGFLLLMALMLLPFLLFTGFLAEPIQQLLLVFRIPSAALYYLFLLLIFRASDTGYFINST